MLSELDKPKRDIERERAGERESWRERETDRQTDRMCIAMTKTKEGMKLIPPLPF